MDHISRTQPERHGIWYLHPVDRSVHLRMDEPPRHESLASDIEWSPHWLWSKSYQSEPVDVSRTNISQIMAVLAPALVCLVDESSADMFGLSIYAFLQSVTASVAPLLVIPMYQKLGVRTASNSLATLCLAVALLFSLYLRQSRR